MGGPGMSKFAAEAAKPAALVVGLVVAGAVVYFLFGSKLKAAAAAVGTAVNPTSDRNLAYRGVNAVGAAITGRDSFSLGSWIYDKVHGDENAVSKPDPKTEEERSFWGQLNPFD